jgi:geranylgeranyl reductase family protein
MKRGYPLTEVEKRYDAGIIGAGPVGSYTAWRLAEQGFSVALIEEHPEIGRPEQCAGLVNRGMFELPGLDDFLDGVRLHNIVGADIFSPSGIILPLRAGRVKAVSIDRARFDKALARKAARSGADVHPCTKMTSVDMSDGEHEITLEGINGKEKVKVDFLIGCDGAASAVRRSLGFNNPQSVIPGVAVMVEIEEGTVPDDLVAVFTGERTAKGFFAWAVPAGSRNTMRIGLASDNGVHLREGMISLFNDPRIFRWLGLQDGASSQLEPISLNFGPVPMGSPKTIIKDRVVILGDSSGMAKPTSGGGIYPGLMASDGLADSIKEEGELSNRSLELFRDRWGSGYGRELERSRFFRKIISQVEDEEVEEVVSRMSDPELMAIINEEGDIDHPLRLALLLIKKDPSLLKLVPRFLPHMRRLI